MNGWVPLDNSDTKTYNCNLTPQQVQQQMALAKDFGEADQKKKVSGYDLTLALHSTI